MDRGREEEEEDRGKVLLRKRGKNPEDTTYRAKQGKGSIQYSKKAYKIKFGFY